MVQPSSRRRRAPSKGNRADGEASPRVVEILARFRVIFRSARQHYQSVQHEVGISGAQLRALAIIAANENCGVSALARDLLVRQPTASKLVEQLVKLGLARRRRSPVDQRAMQLAVTARGRALLARAPGPLRGVLADALHSLEPDRLAALGEHLDEVLELMRLRDDRARFLPISEL